MVKQSSKGKNGLGLPNGNNNAPNLGTNQRSLQDWIQEIGILNAQYDELVQKRNIEVPSRTKYRMVSVRKETEAVYREIIKRIEASIVLTEDPIKKEFVNELNGFIKKRRDVVAQREGIRHAANN